MEAKKLKGIIHHKTIDKLMQESLKKDSTKPLINEIKKVVVRTLPFEDYMLLAYDHPNWRWN